MTFSRQSHSVPSLVMPRVSVMLAWVKPGDLAHRLVAVGALAVLGGVLAGVQAGALAEAGPGDAVELDGEVVGAVGVDRRSAMSVSLLVWMRR